jgi:transmembrane sensor
MDIAGAPRDETSSAATIDESSDIMMVEDLDAPAKVGTPPTAPSWRALARDGAYGAAYARLSAEGPSAVRDTPEDLLLAADVARLGGHPERAVGLLERVVSGYPFDSRAPLASFTLGRTLLEQLGRPRPAARAFATARQLDRAGALAQDALAREVEAWSRAGEADKARARAVEYLKRYPKGRRVSAVRRLGGID